MKTRRDFAKLIGKRRKLCTVKEFSGFGEAFGYVSQVTAAERAQRLFMNDHKPKMLRDEFYGSTAWEDAETRAILGHAATGERAAALMRKLADAPIEAPRKRRVRSVAGHRPCVPAYLAGAPAAMIRTVRERDENAPLSIVVNCVSSGMVGAATMETRGVAVAALAAKLASKRPISLYALFSAATYTHGPNFKGEKEHTSLALIKIPTAPFDIRRAAYNLSSQAIGRGFGFALYHAMHEEYLSDTIKSDYRKRCACGYGISWPFDNNKYATDELGNDLAKHYFGHDVFYMPGVFGHDKDVSQMRDNPTAWINEKVKALTS